MDSYEKMQDEFCKVTFKATGSTGELVQVHPLITILCCHSEDGEGARLSIISDKDLTGDDAKLVDAIRALVASQYTKVRGEAIH